MDNDDDDDGDDDGSPPELRLEYEFEWTRVIQQSENAGGVSITTVL